MSTLPIRPNGNTLLLFLAGFTLTPVIDRRWSRDGQTYTETEALKTVRSPKPEPVTEPCDATEFMMGL